MRSKSVILPFIISLFAIPIIFALATSVGGPATADNVTMALFGATVLVEMVALIQIISARKLFAPSDPGYLTWTLIIAFLVVRLLAEARLATLNFQLVPKYVEGGPSGLFFYTIVLRYLYTASDALFIAALAKTIHVYKSSPLTFNLMKRDYLYMSLAAMMPILTYAFRDNLLYSLIGSDKHIVTYRLVAVTVGALIACLCLIVRRYVLQMGGGAVARVWSTVVIAGIARDASFLALALLSSPWRSGAQFLEQYLLWIFACCWLIAALYQHEVLPKTKAASVAVAAG